MLVGGGAPGEAAGEAEPLGLGQIGVAAPQLLLGAPQRGVALRALDGDAGDLSELPDQLELALAWAGRLILIEGEDADHLVVAREDRRRPARPQAVTQHQRGPRRRRPARVGRDIRGDDLALLVRRHPARPVVAVHHQAVEHLVVGGRQAGAGPVAEAHPVGIDREHAAQPPGRGGFDHTAERAQHLGERNPLGHHLEQPLLARQQRLGPLAVVDVGAQPVPEVDAALAVAQRKYARALPAEDAVRPAQPRFEVEGLAGLHGAGPAGQHLVPIRRMEVIGRGLGLDLLERLVEVFQHLLVAERDPAVRREQRDDRRQAVDDLFEVAPAAQLDDAAEVVRHSASFAASAAKATIRPGPNGRPSRARHRAAPRPTARLQARL